MRIFVWLLRAMIFVALFALAIKNSGPVDLRLYFDTVWQAPMSIVVLGCFTAGVFLGATAAFGAWVRQRHEIGQLRRQLDAQRKSGMDSGASA